MTLKVTAGWGGRSHLHRHTPVSWPGSADLDGGGAPREWVEGSLPQAKPEANFSAGIRCSLVKWAVHLRGVLQGPLHIPPRLGAVWSLWGLSHAQCPAPPSGKKAADIPVPTLMQARRPVGTCSLGSRETFMPPAPGASERPTPRWPPRYLPQRPARWACPRPRTKPGEHTARKSPPASLVLPILLKAKSLQQS